jgi:hypothetical protein
MLTLALLIAFAPQSAEAVPQPTTPTVATHYFYWYRYPDEHFGGPGRESHFHHFVEPEGVSYESPEWHATEFRDMAACGIEIALPVYWGAPGAYDRPNLRFSRAGLAPMVEALDALAANGQPGVKLGLFYDTSTLQKGTRGLTPAHERADLTTTEGLDLFCDTVLDYYAAVPERHWGRHRGRPLVVLYVSAFASQWDSALCDELRKRFAARFDGERPFVVADASWGDVGQDATTAWGAALFGPKLFEGVAQIGPGYDDSPVPGRRTPWRDREDGNFYRWSWDAAIRSKPELVLIETWNEMHEGTEICRTVETGAQYLDLTREAVERLRAGEPGPKISLRHRDVRFRPDLSWGEEAKGLGSVRWRAGEGATGLLPFEWADGPIAIGVGALFADTGERPSTYVYFRVSDHWRFDVDAGFEVEIERADVDTRCVLEFDSRDATSTLQGAYTLARPLDTESRAGGIRVERWLLPAARLANRQNGGADLRLAVSGEPLRLRSIELRPLDRTAEPDTR